MDDYFDLAMRDPGKSEKSVKLWFLAHEAITLYRAWISAMTVPDEVFKASKVIPQLALNALDGLEVIGIMRRQQILAEAMDTNITAGSGHLIEWLLANGAPACPAMAQGKGFASLALARKHAFGSPLRNAIPRVSWCAMAAQHGNLRALMALERAGVGATDRAEVFAGLSQKMGSDKDARHEFKTNHPWVMAMSLPRDYVARSSGLDLADQVQAAWAPKLGADQRVAWEVVEVLSMDHWSLLGLKALIQRAEPMSASTKADAMKSILFAISVGSESSEAHRYTKAAMKWAATCAGPSSGALLEEVALNAESDLVVGGPKAIKSLELVATLAHYLSGAGKWGRADRLIIKNVTTALSVAAAAHAVNSTYAKPMEAAMESAFAMLDLLAGPEHALKTSAPRRI